MDIFYKHKLGGVFAEIGAFDGVELSNTLIFEKERGWTGVCVEPHPETFLRLRQNRTCHCVNAAAGCENLSAVDFTLVRGGTAGCSALTSCVNLPRLEHLMLKHGGTRTAAKVRLRKTQDIFDECGISDIDYLSLDTDGNELDVLNGIDWTRTKIGLMTVENTTGSDEFRFAVARFGFVYIARLLWDDVYASRQLLFQRNQPPSPSRTAGGRGPATCGSEPFTWKG